MFLCRSLKWKYAIAFKAFLGQALFEAAHACNFAHVIKLLLFVSLKELIYFFMEIWYFCLILTSIMNIVIVSCHWSK